MPERALTDFIEEVTGERHLRVEDDLGDGFVVLRTSEAERRQARHDIRSTEDIIIEMLRNARDASARNIFVAVSRDGDLRKITMLDDGSGIPDHLTKRIFDARVTSKLDTVHIDTWGVHGRGMALYAVRANAKRAYVAATKLGDGSSLVVETDTSVLPEKVDQSSFPVFVLSDSGTVVVRGTRNINRTVAEFAYVERDHCTVYLGSPVEIAATLYEFGTLLLPASVRAFSNDIASVGVCKRLALASSPDDFSLIAQSIGLSLSSRSARRIMDGEVDSLAPVADGVSVDKVTASASNKSGRKRHLATSDQRGMKISHRDREQFSHEVKQAFVPLAEAYYLESDVDVSVSVRGDSLHVSIPLAKLR